MRPATACDIPRITDLVERLIEASGIPQAVDRAHAQAVLMSLILRPDALVLVTEGGFLAASIERSVINPEPIACEHGWFATDRSGLRLLRAFEAWAKSHEARVRLSTGVAGPDLSRLGYRAVEMAWVRD
ncbi:hypothetical protein GCM10010873_26550 [Cypionkella aquatica]|uniref:Uncharacterized protein n=1 Tax=Cypionkella aquatica TaxID=1756042 RepID=A0AA37X573_9RHOB|nr:hypothetical protein [Cypionkella aquatica]GLS87681.1 hypothetical protein GCM10010873_26550 [Cypionkella aquatica]